MRRKKKQKQGKRKQTRSTRTSVPLAENGNEPQPAQRSETGAVQNTNHNRSTRKANRMTVFLSVITLTVCTILVGIAIANWQKGGLGNYWHAFGWGIASYLLFGFGAAFTYYYAIIKPAKADVHVAETAKETSAVKATTATVERPELFFEQASIKPISAGERAKVHLTVRNAGNVHAHAVEIQTAISVVLVGPVPLMDFYAPNVVLPEPVLYDLIPAGERAKFTPKSENPITKKQIEQLNNKTHLLFFTGRGHYQDANGSRYSFVYCFMYNREATPSLLVQCPSRYWPTDAQGKPEANPDKRAWMIATGIKMEGFKSSGTYTILATMMNVGELPAIIKNVKIDARPMKNLISYSEPMKWAEIDNSEVINLTQTPFPVSVVAPGQKITIPLNGSVSPEMFKGVMQGTRFLHVWWGVQYETKNVLRYTAACAFYDPKLREFGGFGVCGGGTE